MPVSYAHLAAFWNNQQLTQNITKVSEQLFQSVTQQRNELDKADSNAEFGMENGPVSYTHLDVYKRQVVCAAR